LLKLLPGRRLPPIQSGKAGIIAVVCDPCAGALDGESGEPGIAHERPFRIGANAKLRENFPVPFAGRNDFAMRLAEQIVAIGKGFFGAAGISKCAWIGDDPHHGAQRKRRHSELRIARDNSIEPRFADRVPFAIPAEGVNQDIDVGQDHFRPAA